MNPISLIIGVLIYFRDHVLSFLVVIYQAVWKAFQAIDKIGFFIVGLVMVGLVYAEDLIVWLVQTMPSIESQVSAAAHVSGTATPSSLINALGIVNAVVPLNELFALAETLLAIYVLTVGVRIVKSWLPSVN